MTAAAPPLHWTPSRTKSTSIFSLQAFLFSPQESLLILGNKSTGYRRHLVFLCKSRGTKRGAVGEEEVEARAPKRRPVSPCTCTPGKACKALYDGVGGRCLRHKGMRAKTSHKDKKREMLHRSRFYNTLIVKRMIGPANSKAWSIPDHWAVRLGPMGHPMRTIGRSRWDQSMVSCSPNFGLKEILPANHRRCTTKVVSPRTMKPHSSNEGGPVTPCASLLKPVGSWGMPKATAPRFPSGGGRQRESLLWSSYRLCLKREAFPPLPAFGTSGNSAPWPRAGHYPAEPRHHICHFRRDTRIPSVFFVWFSACRPLSATSSLRPGGNIAG